MNRIHVSNFSGAYYRWNVEITLGKLRRPNADGLVGETNVQRIPVGIAIDRNRADAQLLAGAYDPQSNFATIRDQDFLEHEICCGQSVCNQIDSDCKHNARSAPANAIVVS